jgi:micrococcal nuclease
MDTPSPQPATASPADCERGVLSVLVLAVLVAALLAGCYAQTPEPAGEAARVAQSQTDDGAARVASVWRVIDGDTVEIVFDDGDGQAEEDEFEKVRVRGIDAPESHASSKLDRDAERSALDRQTVRTLGEAAAAHAEALLPPGTAVAVEGRERDRYGRLVAYLAVEDAAGPPFDLGARMIADGFAHAYDGGGRYPHERMDYYRHIERYARAQRLGLWADGRLAPLTP